MSKETNSISICHVGKCYKIYARRNDRLKEWLLPFVGKKHEEKWVLKDVNIEVAPGEAVGIIGMNGAGKSTLLKIITGTTVPTTGSVSFNGRVSALLELGLGFHGDFTGRQNVYMSGQLLGYTIEEINECMEQIEAFAEIGAAIDAPVRTYSSGMQVRLAFSVATMKRPDILIVDEALSVGDSYFQHKSFGRIKEFCEEGTTLLLVSHDATAIQAVCDRAVLLDHGEVLKIGQPQEIMDYYNAMLGGNDGEPIQQEKQEDGSVRTISGNGQAVIENIVLSNRDGSVAEMFNVGEQATLTIEAAAMENLQDMSCGILIKNTLGESVYGVNSYDSQLGGRPIEKGARRKYIFSIPMNIGPGNYSVTVALHSGDTHVESNYEWRDMAVIFQIVRPAGLEFVGAAYLNASIDIVG
ncbi:ABC transporter ATP-binding protein [Selenomonas sp. AB3002]|uniref:ABC transporter ATP-binding protein n=1 Tax=Selenomonas sp. AB3002 TaxID=1392502 RepID=UPI0004953D8B